MSACSDQILGPPIDCTSTGEVFIDLQPEPDHYFHGYSVDVGDSIQVRASLRRETDTT